MIGDRRGGVAMAAIGASTAFGAICGSSVATTATMGRAALPELRRCGYDEALATGTLAIGGTLGILIPPSIVLVVYAIATEQNIAKLFMAALVPGLLAATFYFGVIAWLVRRDPAAGPAGPRLSGADRREALIKAWPVLLVAVAVVGGIYGGVFTPTEGAAVGVVMVLLLGLATRMLGIAGIAQSLRQTAQTTAMIFIVLLGAEMFNAFLAISELPVLLAEAVGGAALPPHAVLAALLLFYILLGSVMDELAMLLLTLPVFFPVVMGLDLGRNFRPRPRSGSASWYWSLSASALPHRRSDERVRHEVDRRTDAHHHDLSRRHAVPCRGSRPADAVGGISRPVADPGALVEPEAITSS